MEYVNVANIIEQERKKRQAQIFKGVDTNIIDHIEKAHEAEFQKGYTEGYTEELPENLQRFSNDIESFNKAETEFLLSKIQGELNANFNNPLLKSMKTIALNHLNTEIEKAKSGVYADTAENRKLGRVGQQYGSKKQDDQPAKVEIYHGQYFYNMGVDKNNRIVLKKMPKSAIKKYKENEEKRNENRLNTSISQAIDNWKKNY